MPGILYIINPAAYGGQGISIWEKYLNLLTEKPAKKDIQFTDKPLHAIKLASNSFSYDIIVAVGGDGTVSEVISGIMLLKEPRPKLGIIPAGTGNDTAASLGINSLQKAKEALFGNNPKKFDLIKIRCSSISSAIERYSVVFCTVGLGAESIRQVRPWMKRFLGSTIAYYLGTLISVLIFKPQSMSISWESDQFIGKTWLVIIANAEWGGGQSMSVAPGAKVDDGNFDITIVKDQSKLRILSKLPKFATGKHIEDSQVLYFPSKNLKIDTDQPVFITLDGDIIGQTPAEFSICPNAIEILAPK